MFALVARTADALRLPPECVEKDYWITELLRSVASPIEHGYVVFKGGTSLSKGYDLIERFSEDVDILMVVTRKRDRGFGKGGSDRVLKDLCSRTFGSTTIRPFGFFRRMALSRPPRGHDPRSGPRVRVNRTRAMDSRRMSPGQSR